MRSVFVARLGVAKTLLLLPEEEAAKEADGSAEAAAAAAALWLLLLLLAMQLLALLLNVTRFIRFGSDIFLAALYGITCIHIYIYIQI